MNTKATESARLQLKSDLDVIHRQLSTMARVVKPQGQGDPSGVALAVTAALLKCRATIEDGIERLGDGR